MSREKRELMSPQDQQEVLKILAGSFEQKLGSLFHKKESFKKLADFSEGMRPYVNRYRRIFVDATKSSYGDDGMFELFDEDPNIIPCPKTKDERIWRPWLVNDRKNWDLDFDLFVSLEFALTEMEKDYHAKLETISSPLKERFLAFKSTLAVLTKSSIHQLISGLNQFPSDHPKRHIYIHFWADCFLNRFQKRLTVAYTLNCALGRGHDGILMQYPWSNSILGYQAYWSLIQELFLEQYPWNKLMRETYELFWAMNAMPECIISWLRAYFKPMIQTNIASKSLENAADDFVTFFKKYLEIKEKFTNGKISSPPTFPISFQIDSDYLKRMIMVLEKSKKPEYQIEHLDDLPSMELIQYAHQQNFYGVITNDLFVHNKLPVWVKTNSAATAAQQTVLLQTIQKNLDLRIFVAEILCWISLFKPEHFLAAKSFFNESDERTIANIVPVCLLSVRTQPMQLLPVWNTLACELRDEYGIEIVEQILSLQADLPDFIKISELLLDLVDYFNLQLLQRRKTASAAQISFRSPADVFSKHKTAADVIVCLKALQIQYWEQRFPEKSVEQLRHDFLTITETVRSPLSTDECELLLAQCEKIDVIGKEYFGVSTVTLGQRAKALGRSIPWMSDSDKIHLFAIIREVIRQEFKILPRKTQLLAVLGMIHYPEQMKGRIAQMKTGEGKSTVITLLATFLGCQGRFVDIITSNYSLAIRDKEKYAEFYALFGITCSHICNRNQTAEDFNGQIIYATNTDVEFSLLWNELRYFDIRYTVMDGKKVPRPFDAVLIDEVDVMFIENARNSAQIADHSTMNVSWVYQPILVLKESMGDARFLALDPQDLRRMLAIHQNGHYAVQTHDFTEQQLKDWQNNAVEAQRKIEGADYIVQSGSRRDPADTSQRHIVIMDKNTGHLSNGTQWPGGLHQFIEIKHGISPSDECNTIAAISHPVFFNKYDEIYGLTGTIGELIERDEIKAIYHVDIFDVPTHTPVLREKRPGVVVQTTEEQIPKIIASIQFHRANDRPVLILFETINQTEKFSAALKAANIPHLVLNEKQKEKEDFVIARAREAGAVTVATNMAGRGTDIVLSARAKAAGGLHVIFAFYPQNLRIEEQGFGRAGRQGQPGSGEMILSLQDKMIQQLLRGRPPEEILLKLLSGNFITFLSELRTKSILEASRDRQSSSEKEAVLFLALNRFFEILKGVVKQLASVDTKHLMGITNGTQALSAQNHFLILPDHPVFIAASIKMQETGLNISASTIDYLRNAYLTLMRNRWARWYMQVSHHECRQLPIAQYKSNLQEKFDELYDDGFSDVFEKPPESFYGWVTQLKQVVSSTRRVQNQSAFFAAALPARTEQIISLANTTLTIEEKKQTIESIFQAIDLKLSRLILVGGDFTGSIDKDFPADMRDQMKQYREQWAKDFFNNWGRDWKKALLVLDDDTQMTKQSAATAGDRFPLTMEDIDYVRGHWKWLITCCRQFEFLFDQWRKNFDYNFSLLKNPEVKLSHDDVGRELWPGTITGFRKEIFDSFRGAFSFLTKTSAEQCVAGLHQLDMFERYERLMHWMDAISCRYKKDNLIIPIFGGGWGFDKYTTSAVLIDDSVFWSVANTLFLSRYSWDRFKDFSQYDLFHKINIFSETMVLWLKSYFNSQAMQNASKEKLSHAVLLFSDFIKAVKKRSDQSGFQLEAPASQVDDQDLQEIIKVGSAIGAYR